MGQALMMFRATNLACGDEAMGKPCGWSRVWEFDFQGASAHVVSPRGGSQFKKMTLAGRDCPTCSSKPHRHEDLELAVWGQRSDVWTTGRSMFASRDLDRCTAGGERSSEGSAPPPRCCSATFHPTSNTGGWSYGPGCNERSRLGRVQLPWGSIWGRRKLPENWNSLQLL